MVSLGFLFLFLHLIVASQQFYLIPPCPSCFCSCKLVFVTSWLLTYSLSPIIFLSCDLFYGLQEGTLDGTLMESRETLPYPEQNETIR